MEAAKSEKASDRSLPLLPRHGAKPWTWLTHSWCEPFVHRVRKTGSLESSDLYDLGTRHSAAALAESFLAQHSRLHREAVAHNDALGERCWLRRLTFGLFDRRRSERQVIMAGLFTLRDQWLEAISYAPLFAAGAVATPLVSRSLVRYCRSGSMLALGSHGRSQAYRAARDPSVPEPPLYIGILATLGLAAVCAAINITAQLVLPSSTLL